MRREDLQSREALLPVNDLPLLDMSLHKPRDRSHYEHFTAYHESFYRYVESQSLTPFSGPAVDRGLAATIVGMTRLSEVAMTPSRAVVRLGRHRAQAEAVVDALAERARVHDEDEAGERLAHALRERGKAVLDSWEQVLASAVEGSGQRRYSPFDEAKEGKALLRTLEEAELAEALLHQWQAAMGEGTIRRG